MRKATMDSAYPRIMAILVLGMAPVFTAVQSTANPQSEQSASARPAFHLIGAITENSAISMECQGEPPYLKIDCTFNQVSVHKKASIEIKKEEEEGFARIERMSEADFHKIFPTDCKQQLRDVKRELLAKPTLSLSKFKAVDNDIHSVGTVCDCGHRARTLFEKRDCLRKALVDELEGRKNTCAIASEAFTLAFKKTGPRRWISLPQGNGACSAVNVAVLEHEGESELLWTFTQTRAAGDPDLPRCKNVRINRPLTFSWKVPAKMSMSCETVSFSLFD